MPLHKILLEMYETQFRKRPNCAVILSRFNTWDITTMEVKNSHDYQENISKIENFSNPFFTEFVNSKFSIDHGMISNDL